MAETTGALSADDAPRGDWCESCRVHHDGPVCVCGERLYVKGRGGGPNNTSPWQHVHTAGLTDHPPWPANAQVNSSGTDDSTLQPAEPVYRWNWYGTRKHLEHIGAPDRWGRQPNTLCGDRHEDRDASLLRHSEAKLDTAPLCKKCAKAAGQVTPEVEIERLSGALSDAIELADSLIDYVPEYFREKWGFDAELAEIKQRARIGGDAAQTDSSEGQ